MSTAFHPTCNEAHDGNHSKTLLNMSPPIFGSIQIRIRSPKKKAVSTLRMATVTTGSLCSTARESICASGAKPATVPLRFGQKGGGHPHCVAVANDGMVYACDRPGNRIFETDRLGKLIRTINVKPADGPDGYGRANDIVFSRRIRNKNISMTWIWATPPSISLTVKSGNIVGHIGVGPGHNAGQFTAPHQLASWIQKGNIYVSETIDSRRVPEVSLSSKRALFERSSTALTKAVDVSSWDCEIRSASRAPLFFRTPDIKTLCRTLSSLPPGPSVE